MYKQASKMKLRFTGSSHAAITPEDLRDLPLEELDTIAQQCQKEAENKTTSFIKDVKPVNEAAVLRFKIVQDVIKDRLAERDASVTAQKNAQQKQMLLALKAQKQADGFADLSIEELDQLINAL